MRRMGERAVVFTSWFNQIVKHVPTDTLICADRGHLDQHKKARNGQFISELPRPEVRVNWIVVFVHGATISEIASFFSDILVIWATGSWSFSGPTPKSPVARRATGSQNSVARRQNPVAMAPGHPLSFNAVYRVSLLRVLWFIRWSWLVGWLFGTISSHF